MKKKILASLLAALILISIVAPVASFATSGAFALNCDTATGWKTDVGGGTLGDFLTVGTVDAADYKEGSGSLSLNSANTVAINAFLNQCNVFVWSGTEVNTGVSEDEAVLSMWIYASNANAFNTAAKIQIGSGGAADTDCYEFVLNNGGNKAGTLTAGWNKIEWKLSDATKVGSPDLTKINFFKLYSLLTPADTVVKIDNIQIGKPVVPTKENLNCDTSTGWKTDVGGGTLGDFLTVGTVDAADYKEGSGSLSLNSANTVSINAFLNQCTVFVWTGEAFDAAVSEDKAELSMWIYASNADAFNTAAKIQIGSGGAADTDCYEFVLNNGGNKAGTLTAGWNKVEWKLSDATKVGNPDLTKINFFKLYSLLTPADTVVKIDGIQITKVPDAPAAPSTKESLNCDTATGWKTDVGGGVLGEFLQVGKIDTDNKKEGAGALSLNSADTVTINAFLNQSTVFVWTGEAFDVGYDEGEAVLSMWLYASNGDAFDTAAKIQIGSGGAADTDCYEFVMNEGGNKYGDLKEGWNKIEWKLSDAVKVGNPDLTKINFFKLYSLLTPADTIVKIDAISFISNNDVTEPEAYSVRFSLDCDSAEPWLTDVGQGALGNFTRVGIVDTENKKQGNGSLSMNSADSVGVNAFLNQSVTFVWNGSPVNVDLAEKDAVLSMWIYASNDDAFKTGAKIQIGSGGVADVDCYEFVLNKGGNKANNLVKGWNHIEWSLADADKVGQPNLGKINFFKVYSILTPADTTVKIDDIKIISKNDATGNSTSPKTGDCGNILIPSLSLGTSAAALIGICMNKKSCKRWRKNQHAV